MIEAEQRPASAQFLMKLAAICDLNIPDLAPASDAQLAAEFSAAPKDPLSQASRHLSHSDKNFS